MDAQGRDLLFEKGRKGVCTQHVLERQTRCFSGDSNKSCSNAQQMVPLVEGVRAVGSRIWEGGLSWFIPFLRP